MGQYCLEKRSVFGSVLPEKTVSIWVSIACENCQYLGQYCLRKQSVFGSVLPEKTVSIRVSMSVLVGGSVSGQYVSIGEWVSMLVLIVGSVSGQYVSIGYDNRHNRR